MTFAPVAPTQRVAPDRIGPDTYVIHSVQEALGAPLFVYLNSMVITGAEPVIVDTGTVANRKQWLDDVFGIVEPEDVRWVYLSHDDVDHTGNLEAVMERCTNATIVCSWAILERHSNAFEFPLSRVRWVNEGETFDAGDRRFLALRPPLWDSPTTRGLLDESTGVYWGVDSFACPMPGGVVSRFSEIDPDFARDGMAMFLHHALSPWLSLVDHDRYAEHCSRIEAYGMSTIVNAHAPVIEQADVARAFDLVREMPAITPPPMPDQVVLEGLLSGAPA